MAALFCHHHQGTSLFYRREKFSPACWPDWPDLLALIPGRTTSIVLAAGTGG
ncbi:MAG: hypothetical protein JO110_28665 [Acetobacteraceae bacterium]|nr:hypothetical protein [Acetobacteraceae bacterium]